MRARPRLLLACLGALVVATPPAWLWQASRMPASYSVMEMGYVDLGGGRAPAGMLTADGHHRHRTAPALDGGKTRALTALTPDASRPADRRFQLVVASSRVRLASGREVDGYTVNGTTPGPVLEVAQGELVEVTLVNESVAGGATLHWHGVDVPAAADGVAGVTQDAVAVGESFTYRFVADDPGTYWYHSHQVSHEQVQRGLLGAFVVRPPPRADDPDRDVVVVSHTYGGARTLNGREGDLAVAAEPGERVRVRLVNTDNGPAQVWSAQPYLVRAVDSRDLHGPTWVSDRRHVLTAGGRADVEVVVPRAGAVRIQTSGDADVVVGPPGSSARKAAAPRQPLDLLHYGTPAALGLDPTDADRTFDYAIGRRPGFVAGRPGFWWSVNGRLWPDMPMFVVEEGDVVRMRISNNSGDVHPMHLHGHHAVVLSRNGVAATGSPWWVDSLDVADGERYEVAFLADNPGIWASHCHNLGHAAQGLLAHLAYAGVDTPYRVGGGHAGAANHPE